MPLFTRVYVAIRERTGMVVWVKETFDSSVKSILITPDLRELVSESTYQYLFGSWSEENHCDFMTEQRIAEI